MNCSCLICEPKDANKAKAEKEEKKKEADATQGGSCVWVGTGAKVSPQQVDLIHKRPKTVPRQVSRKAEDKEMAPPVETVKQERPVGALSCKRKLVHAVLKITGELHIFICI